MEGTIASNKGRRLGSANWTITIVGGVDATEAVIGLVIGGAIAVLLFVLETRASWRSRR